MNIQIPKRKTSYGANVLLIDHGLNPEDLAMLQALLARSAVSMEVALKKVLLARREALASVLRNYDYDGFYDGAGRVFEEVFARGGCEGLLDQIVAISCHTDASALARRIHKDYTVGYGHKSIADCGFTTLVSEGVSMLAAKAIQDWGLYNGAESSTRVLDFRGRKTINPFDGTPLEGEARDIIDRWVRFYEIIQGPVADEVRRRYPRQPGEDEPTYEKAVSARRFDVCRAWLTAGATTQLSCTMTLRQFADKIPTLLNHPLAEVRGLGKAWQELLCERYLSSGSFGGAAGISGVGLEKDPKAQQARDSYSAAVGRSYTYQMPKFIGAARGSRLGFSSTIDLATLMEGERALLRARPRGALLPAFLEDIGQVSCYFELCFGSFRDIQRQRNPPPRMPLLVSGADFERWYLDQLPADLRDEAINLISKQVFAIDGLLGRGARDEDLQYLTAMGFKVPVCVTFGLPAFIYVVELRSGVHVHPTLRQAVLRHMVAPFRKAYPEVTLHVDESEDSWDIRRGNQTITRK